MTLQCTGEIQRYKIKTSRGFSAAGGLVLHFSGSFRICPQRIRCSGQEISRIKCEYISADHETPGI